MDNSARSLRSVVNEDGAAILDVDRGAITTLNPTGAYIWQHLQEGEPVEAIILGLARETGQEAADLEQDVHDFIDSLGTNHLLSDLPGGIA